jgi:hypothetical protein
MCYMERVYSVQKKIYPSVCEAMWRLKKINFVKKILGIHF